MFTRGTVIFKQTLIMQYLNSHTVTLEYCAYQHATVVHSTKSLNPDWLKAADVGQQPKAKF